MRVRFNLRNLPLIEIDSLRRSIKFSKVLSFEGDSPEELLIYLDLKEEEHREVYEYVMFLRIRYVIATDEFLYQSIEDEEAEEEDEEDEEEEEEGSRGAFRTAMGAVARVFRGLMCWR